MTYPAGETTSLSGPAGAQENVAAVTAVLAKRAAETPYCDLPEGIKELARQCFIDWFAVTLPGSQDDLASIMIEIANSEGCLPASSIVGHTRKVSPQQAALINGTTSHALDYDDVNFVAGAHCTATLAPAVLALGEARNATGAEVLTAFVAGYEVMGSVGSLVAPGHYDRGFHSTGTVGAFGAAAACARLLGLSAEQTATALGIAAAQTAGLKSMFGTMCKPLHAGKAAQNGLLAAELAARGFTSRSDVLECPQGFAQSYSPDFRPELAIALPPGGYHLRRNLFKYHASCYITHAPIECARKIREQYRLSRHDIREVLVRVNAGADMVCNIQEPKSGLEAKFSLRLATAMALSGVDTSDIHTFSDEIAADPDLVLWRNLVRAEFSPEFKKAQGEVAVVLKDGGVLKEHYDASVPATDLVEQRARLLAKLESLGSPILGEKHSALVQMLVRLDELPSIGCVMKVAAPGN